MERLTFKNAYEYLSKRNYKYKGRTIKSRTIRTMAEKGIINVELCECGGKLIKKEDLDKEIERNKE